VPDRNDPEAPATPVLEAASVSIRFGGVQALQDVDFAVNDHEIVGILGPNGAGKTTFFNCVSGFYTPTSGRIWIGGTDVTDMRPDERARLGLGRTFQQVGLVRSFTVLENLVVAQHMNVTYGVAGGLFGAPWTLREEKVLRARAMEVLDFMGLADLRDSPVTGLPYGTLKMCEVAAVVATDQQSIKMD
jgi:branched-chain amino acid transport system ATP-binding protein